MTQLTPLVSLQIQCVDDIVKIRRQAREQACGMGFGLADQTRLATVVSELARNALQYANGGTGHISDASSSRRKELQVIISDHGPGIDNIELAMRDGYSSGQGLGAGLPGCKRLMDSFSIETTPGQGTRVRVAIYVDI